jgi:ADP-ribosylglycohydrolase
MPSRTDRIAGGLLGLLVGDALGVPYEFHSPADIPPLDEIELEPPAGFEASHGVAPGTFSDDGAHALCLLASLLDCGALDPKDFGRRLVDWFDRGYMAVDGNVFDCGNQTVIALNRLRKGTTALDPGLDEFDNGNGSLMRVLPLALWHRGDDAELIANACLQSRVTHGHPRSQACCAFYVLWARRVLEEHAEPWDAAVRLLRGMWPDASPLRAELERHIRPDDPSPGNGSGYVVDCLRSARWALRQPTYEAVVKSAIALGHDTDTTACVAGGIAGLRDGIDAIPERWIDRLLGRDLVDPLLARLVAR